MTTTTGSNDLSAIGALKPFLAKICSKHDGDGWVSKLARSRDRWISVEDSLSTVEQQELSRIAFESPLGGFSACNLKAHYVLDEDFINDGTAFVLFALVGSDWTHVVRVNNQNQFTPQSAWLDGEE